MRKFRIKAVGNDEQWLESFNSWNNSECSSTEILELSHEQLVELNTAIEIFNNEVAQGPAIRLVEV